MNTFYIVFLLVLFYFVYNHNETFLQDNQSCKKNMNMTAFKHFNSIGLSWYDENEDESEKQGKNYTITLMREDGNDVNNYTYTYKASNAKQFNTFIFPKKNNNDGKYRIKLKDDTGNECMSNFFYIDLVKSNNSSNINYIKCNPDSTYNISKGKYNNMCKLDIFPMSKDEFKKSSDTLNEIDKTLEKLSSSEEKVLTLDAT